MFAVLRILADEGTNFIKPHMDELVWGSIAFVLLFLALSKFAFPKFKQTMTERTERIRGQLESAENTKTEADRMLEEYRAKLAAAQSEAGRIIEESKKTAEGLRRELVARAEEEAAEIVTRARGEVGAERDRAIAELRASVADLTITVAEKVIGRELQSESAQRSFVDQTIAELSRMGNGRN